MPPKLSLGSAVRDVDSSLARRRTGSRAKGREAWEVLHDPLGVDTVEDLLHHYPRRYIDRSRVARIATLVDGAPVTVIVRVRRVNKRSTRNRRTIVVVTVTDDSGASLDLTFFNQPWIASQYRVGQELAVSGIAKRYRGRMQLANQEVELLSSAEGETDLVHTGRITPVHPASEGIAPRTIRELVHRAVDQLDPIPEPLPAELVAAEHLGSFDRAIRDIHFPVDDAALNLARERLKFDELFTLELGVAFRKQRVEQQARGIEHDAAGSGLPARLLASIGFEPTGSQLRATERIAEAMARARPMNVLLQGDVGSGKTLVAVHAALVAIGSGHQAAIMAPTEVLASQHFRSVKELLDGIGAVPYLDHLGPAAREPKPAAEGQLSLLGTPDAASPANTGEGDEGRPVTFALLTGAVTGADRRRVLAGIADGQVDLVVGTHALVQEAVVFADLSLAVVDEQHRFGLEQRSALKGKGTGAGTDDDTEPDVLIMTATPIPRTLALTYYGDLDVVVLDEMPKGRAPIETRAARTEMERAAADELVRSEVAAGRQAFVVCAAIDEANRTQVKAAEAEAERLATQVFPELDVALLHGKMRPKDKAAVMERFHDGGTDVLISTTVVEVGVDVPNATVMLIENAERFGLAQLHQLRGRIGRGIHPGTCILFDASESDNREARARIAAMVRTTDGFELADEDLRLRGEGTLFDVRQSGMPDLRLARLAEDLDLVRRARSRAFDLVDADPGLHEHPDLLAELRRRFAGSIEWLFKS
jgi:ATP-dependent DNA helicase RecG